MVFKVDEARIREVAALEAEADCVIGAGGFIPSELEDPFDRSMDYPRSLTNQLSIELPYTLYQRLEQMAQQQEEFSIDQFVATAIAEKIATVQL